MKRYDLHIHTRYSRCSNNDPKQILLTAKKNKLDGIAITDHNSIKGAIETKKLNRDKNFEVIIGEEIKTDCGEILAYYLTKEIKPGKFEEVIAQIKQQHALAVIAHPYDFGIIRKPINTDLKELAPHLDGVEVLNGRCLFSRSNKKAKQIAHSLNIPGVAGSDAHFLFEIGKCCTLFPQDLRSALKNNKLSTEGTSKGSLRGRLFSIFQQIKND